MPVGVVLNETLSDSIPPCSPLLPTHPTPSLSAAHQSPRDRSSSHSELARPSSSTPSSLDALRSTYTSRSTPSTRSQSPSRWWFQTDRDSASRERATGILNEDESNQGNIAKHFRTPRAPLVFCHGILGFDTVSIANRQLSHWPGIKKILEGNGCEVLITAVPATSSPVERAKILEKTISEAYPDRAVHLIGHSMGGIDCRYLITHLTQRSFSVLSLTTISAPHHGTAFADHILAHAAGSILPSILSFLHLFPSGGGDGKGFESLTLEAMKEFNRNTPDVEGVRYFSWGAEYQPVLFDTWKYPHSVIFAKEGPNDGLVSSQSAHWGTYLGTLKDVSHVGVLGWTGWVARGIRFPTFNFQRMRASVHGQEVGFSPGRFYLSMADLLAGVEDEGGYVRDVRRTSSEGAKARLEKVLRQTPSPSGLIGGEDEEIDEAEGYRTMPGGL
ncbi:Alpha/Beta hydrolase protein [Pisolithus marmoratus]|nr:Alpha/Beta hydrolase protein [Pisolithus marmoratus]